MDTVKFFDTSVPAGFPSPADEFIHRNLDLNELIVKHPASTFFVRVEGDSMSGVGIYSGSILAVDRSIEPKNKSVIIAFVDGEYTVKTLLKKGKQIILHPENDKYKDVIITEGMDFEVWGVVTYVIRKV